LIAISLVAAHQLTSTQRKLISEVQRVRGADPQWVHFVQFVRDFQREYDDVVEMNTRFDNFKAVMAEASENAQRNPRAQFGVNDFSDIHPDEWRATYLGLKISNITLPKWNPKIPSKHKLPKVRDGVWCDPNTPGICTPVKDQGQCGSCWAFSATETVESNVLKGQTALSPQQVVDCDTGSQGCNGGDPRGAIDYIAGQGQEADSDYPYNAVQGSCQFDPSKAVSGTQGHGAVAVADGNEDSLKSYLMSTGTASVCVDASQWQSYSGGVMTDCGQNTDHAVQATGVDSSQNAYIVRNSWNTGWGVQGYIYIGMGSNVCNIASRVTSTG